jgi:hypothetical protein
VDTLNLGEQFVRVDRAIEGTRTFTAEAPRLAAEMAPLCDPGCQR